MRTLNYLEISIIWVVVLSITGSIIGLAARFWRKKPNGSKH